jgi:hypothetical protein
MNAKFPNWFRLLALTVVLTGLGGGYFLFHQHNVYAPVHQFAKAGDSSPSYSIRLRLPLPKAVSYHYNRSV